MHNVFTTAAAGVPKIILLQELDTYIRVAEQIMEGNEQTCLSLRFKNTKFAALSRCDAFVVKIYGMCLGN